MLRKLTRMRPRSNAAPREGFWPGWSMSTARWACRYSTVRNHGASAARRSWPRRAGPLELGNVPQTHPPAAEAEFNCTTCGWCCAGSRPRLRCSPCGCHTRDALPTRRAWSILIPSLRWRSAVAAVAAVANPGPHPGRESLPVSDPDELTPAERIDAARKIAAVCYFTGRGPPAVLSRNKRDMRLSKLCVGITHTPTAPRGVSNRLSLENPGNAGARDRRRVG